MADTLRGRRILVARAREQASALAELLVREGAQPVLVPVIELLPPVSFAAIDAALRRFDSFDWLVLTSANAVTWTLARAAELGLSLRPRRVAVVGPATAAAAHAAGWPVTLMPAAYVAESLAEALLPHAAGSRMLLVRAAEARDVLPDRLRAAGADLTIAAAYRNVVPQTSVALLQTLFADARSPHALDAIFFTSASTATHLAALIAEAGVSLPPRVVLASIGPVTSAAMRDHGLTPSVEAEVSTIPGLVSALAGFFTQQASM